MHVRAARAQVYKSRELAHITGLALQLHPL